MTRVRVIVTVDIDDDCDLQPVIDAIWNQAANIVDTEILDRVER